MEKELETLFFYTRNDYLIINNILLENYKTLDKYIKATRSDYEGMIEEMEISPAKRLGLNDDQLANEIFLAYKKRYADSSDKQKAIKTAKNDINNLKSLLKPTDQKIILYRNIRKKHLSDFLNKKEYSYLAFSSCSDRPTNQIYGLGNDEFDFIQLKITVPKNTPLIKVDDYPSYIQNEEGEMILPPFSATIGNIRQVKNKTIISLKLENILTDINENISDYIIN